MMNKRYRFICSVLLGIVFFIGLIACDFRKNEGVLYRLGAVEDVSGHLLQIKDYRGKWVMINYWASWCSPCWKEVPELNAFLKQHSNVVILGVSFDQLPLSLLKRNVAAMKMEYPNLKEDPAAALNIQYIPVLPATFIYTPEGKLKTTLLGMQTQETLEKALREK